MHGDVGLFHRFAPVYDVVMPRAKPAKLEAGLQHARRDVETLLDVGGGPGRASRPLDVPRRLVVDAAPGMLQQARSHGLEGVAGDATRLPFSDHAADAILIVDALHHIRDVPTVFAEAARVLRPGGVLVIREFDPTTVRGRGLVLAERLVRFDSVFYAPDELATELDAAGLAPTVVERGFTYTVAGVRETGEQSTTGAD